MFQAFLQITIKLVSYIVNFLKEKVFVGHFSIEIHCATHEYTDGTE